MSTEHAVPSAGDSLAQLLRVVVITDRRIALPRPLETVVGLALDGGARTVQLRMKDASARTVLEMARPLRELTRAHGALLVVNDRFDVALAADADGVHLGPEDLPVGVVRRVAPAPFVIGVSTDDPEEARAAEAAGASYIGCGSVWPTSSKDLGGEAIGIARLREVVAAVGIPVVGIGGVTARRAPEVARTGAAGVAVIGAVMAAEDVVAAVRGLLTPFQSS